MHIPEFWCGVFATVAVELVPIVACIAFVAIRTGIVEITIRLSKKKENYYDGVKQGRDNITGLR